MKFQTIEACDNRLLAISDRMKEIRSLLKTDENLNLDTIESELDQLEVEKDEIINKRKILDIAKGIKDGTIQANLIPKPGEIGGKRVMNNSNIFYRSQSIADSIQVPEDFRSLDLGKYVKGMVTGRWEGAEQEKRAMLTTATGVLIPEILSAQVIDKARNLSLFTNAGVPVVPMKTNNMTISRIKTDPVFAFKAEGDAANESTMELEAVTLETKTAYGYAYVSLEAINASANLSDVLMMAFSEAMAQCIDNSFLYGAVEGTDGILNDSDINTIDGSVYTDFDAFIKAVGAVKSYNGNPTIAGLNAKTEELLALMKDAEGAYVTPPVTYNNLTKIVSNQLAYDAQNGSDALVFDPNALIIGTQMPINIEVFRGSDECVKKGLVAFRIYSQIDCKTLQPKHITKITSLK